MTKRRSVLITGVAGFIGFRTALRFMSEGWMVYGIDDVNPYYDQKLKYDRLRHLEAVAAVLSAGAEESPFLFRCLRWNVRDRLNLNSMIRYSRPELVIHLAAQAGVRYSFENPRAYVESNVDGHLAVLEAVTQNLDIVKHLVYASSSSVYGEREMTEGGFREDSVSFDAANSPESFYAATKLTNEMTSSVFNKHHHSLRQTGLRFFTVYGPWGRPDMAYYSMAHKIMKGEKIEVFCDHEDEELARDFTYVDDVVEGIFRVSDRVWTPRENAQGHVIMNIGRGSPVSTLDMISILAESLIPGRKVRDVVEFVGWKPGDVARTYANVDRLREATGYGPTIDLTEGLQRFADWFRGYHGYE